MNLRKASNCSILMNSGNIRHGIICLLAIYIFVFILNGTSRAQIHDDYIVASKTYDSPERFALELRIGPYVPDVGNRAFDEIYTDDSGLLMALELDVIAFRLLDILYFNIAGGIGYADYTGTTQSDSGIDTGEESNFDMVPLSLLAVLRVDALARLLDIPIILTGKIGYTWVVWDDEKGGRDIDDGISHGLSWAGQLAIDLDLFDKRSARMLDDEWGINHTFLFLEVYGLNTFKGLELNETTWAAGLGFVM